MSSLDLVVQNQEKGKRNKLAKSLAKKSYGITRTTHPWGPCSAIAYCIYVGVGSRERVEAQEIMGFKMKALSS